MAASLAFSAPARSPRGSSRRLKRLEYRGYDSAGIATLEHGRLERRRAPGKLKNLELRLSNHPLEGAAGIGHTRWATHGKPNETNAHPHASAKVAMVHNGIIENFRELRAELAAKGHRFETETDSEVVAHSRDRRDGSRPLAQGRGRGGAAEAPRRLRAGLPVRRPRGPADRCPKGRAARRRPRPGRDLCRLRRAGARALHRRGHLPRGRRLVRAHARERRDLRRDEPPRRAAPPEECGLGLPDRQGQLPPLHGEGDPRAARGRRPHARPLHRPLGRTGGAALRAALRPPQASTGSRSSPAEPPISRA